MDSKMHCWGVNQDEKLYIEVNEIPRAAISPGCPLEGKLLGEGMGTLHYRYTQVRACRQSCCRAPPSQSTSPGQGRSRSEAEGKGSYDRTSRK